MKKLLVFAPHSAIWQHAHPEALVLDALRQSGWSVTYVTCDRTLSAHCICMMAAKVPVTATAGAKEKVCGSCMSRARLIREEFDFFFTSLQEHLVEADRQEAEVVSSDPVPANLFALELDQVPIGKLALYELLLQHKKADLVFNDEQWLKYRSAIKNCVLVLRAIRRIFDTLKPSHFTVYNSLYSVNAVARYVAVRSGCEAHFMHSGPDLSRPYQTMMIGLEDPFVRGDQLLDLWPRLREIPLTEASIETVTSSFLETFKGRSIYVYSSAKAEKRPDIYSLFGLDPRSKVCVAAMSSTDERFAAESSLVVPPRENLIFADQFEWVRALIRYFSAHPDLSLVIRIHPREFPNKRDAVLSPNALRLKSLLQDLPENVRINWPDDGISLYDLAEEADLFLSAWSSIGTEMPFLGVPVLTYAKPYLYYPVELNETADSVEEYFTKISGLLGTDMEFERIRLLYRWLSLILVHGVLNIEDGVRVPSSGFFSRIGRRLGRIVDPLFQEKKDIAKRPSMLKESAVISESMSRNLEWVLRSYPPGDHEGESRRRETALIVAQLDRISKAMAGNGSPSDTKYFRRIRRIMASAI